MNIEKKPNKKLTTWNIYIYIGHVNMNKIEFRK
jgi:hypothetical protein